MPAVYFTVFVFPPPRLKNGSVAACQSALNQERTAVNLLNKRWVFCFLFLPVKGTFSSLTLIAFLMLIATNHPFLSRDALPSLRMQGFEKGEREGVESIRVGFFVVFAITDRSSGDKKFVRGFLSTIGKWCSAMGFL